MSAATEQNNGDVAVEKVAAAADAIDAVTKEDLKGATKPAAAVSDEKVTADNGTAGKDAADGKADASAPLETLKGTKRPAESKSAESKKAKKDKAADGDSDEEEGLEEIIEHESDIESDEYDIPYEEDLDDIECDGNDDDDDDDDVECDGTHDDDNDDGSGSDDQA